MIAIKFCFYEETDGRPANIETTLGRLVSFNSTASLLEILDSVYILLIGLYENRSAVAELHNDASTLINHDDKPRFHTLSWMMM